MDDEHNDVGGYIYASPECYACHPTGDADDSFNHNLTAFPLTGAHMTTECSQCHATGYAGTPIDCFHVTNLIIMPPGSCTLRS